MVFSQNWIDKVHDISKVSDRIILIEIAIENTVLTHLVPNAPFLYPLKTSANRKDWE